MNHYENSCETFLQDALGNYLTTRPAAEDDVIALACRILDARVRRDDVIESPKAARELVALRLAPHQREVFSILWLDNRHRVIAFEELFFGTIDGCSVHAREVVRQAIHHNAAACILAHNHPSGVAEPSHADRSITSKLREALNLIDVRLLDHLVVGGSHITSMVEDGML